MLYLVATPIGNLEDITFRALATLKKSDLILCEDTRHSLTLLKHYSIQKPLKAYHKFNETKHLEEIIALLNQGKIISLISDAGTPALSDPGFILIKECIKKDIPIYPIPGACSLIHALIASGFTPFPFQFMGFLPRKEKELHLSLTKLINYSGVSICFEAANRLLATVKILKTLNPLISLCIARELTKKFEAYLRGTSTELEKILLEKPLKGECVLLIEGAPQITDYSSFSIKDHVEAIEETHKISKKEAIKIVASLRGEKKRDIYQSLLE